MTSLTARRLDAIRNALAYRLASNCPADRKPDLDATREALSWATEQAMKKGRRRSAAP